MRITTKQRRLLIEIARCERHEAAVRRKDGRVTIEAANTAGSVAFAAGVPEGSVLSALKRLEARGLVEKQPREHPGDFPYSTWGTRWRLTGVGQEALS
ncbi:MAG: hypothetical protein OXE86_21455 [Alphaproteobacteria bacterium]|nr:hypothetical protein [Alphaproteobacteria bacterium]